MKDLFLSIITQKSFLIVELAKPFDIQLMLTAAPMLGESDSCLKLRDLIVEFSRWVLGPKV